MTESRQERAVRLALEAEAKPSTPDRAARVKRSKPESPWGMIFAGCLFAFIGGVALVGGGVLTFVGFVLLGLGSIFSMVGIVAAGVRLGMRWAAYDRRA